MSPREALTFVDSGCAFLPALERIRIIANGARVLARVAWTTATAAVILPPGIDPAIDVGRADYAGPGGRSAVVSTR